MEDVKFYRKYKMYPIEIKLNEKAIRSLISKGNFDGKINFLYEFEVSVEEINKFKNNFVVHYENNNIYVLPIDIEIDEKTIEEAIEKLSKNDVLKFLNDVEKFYKKIYEKNSNDYKELNDRNYLSHFIVGVGLLSFRVGFEIFKKNVNAVLNDYIINSGRVFNSKEVKSIVLNYLSSYDLKERIENFVNYVKLKIIK